MPVVLEDHLLELGEHDV